MLRYARNAVIATCLMACLMSCGDSGKQDALPEATKACNGALTLAQEGEGISEMADRNEKSAEQAARAAALDSRWDNLATAISDLATNDRATEKMGERGQEDPSSLDLTELNRLLDGLLEAKKNVLAECRKVQGAGGDVDQALLDDYTR